jgi:serine-type D-Ala-D-Ala carboxypeptidase (penicillin-binding protein 5/6)
MTTAGTLATVVMLSATTSNWAASTTAHGGSSPALRTLTPRWTVPGSRPSFHWPKSGEGAAAVAGVGLVGHSPRNWRIPIASLTKMMTALVVLADHPLAPGQAGPLVRIGPGDVQDYSQDVQAGESTVRVNVDEVLTEYQLLEALLLPSANNIADRLATWDARSIPRFVAKMNAMANALELKSTHYADASGVDPRSASTAADQALVASTLIADPVVLGIVRRRRVTFPVTGILSNPNPALGIDGIVGVKGGFSSEAHTCLVTAAFRSHHRVLVVSVALGQPGGPARASRIDEALLEEVTKKLVRHRLTTPGRAVGTVTAPGGNNQSVEVIAPNTPRATVVWPGLQLTENITAEPGTSAATLTSSPAGSVVGVLTISAPWGVLVTMPVRLAATLLQRS